MIEELIENKTSIQRDVFVIICNIRSNHSYSTGSHHINKIEQRCHQSYKTGTSSLYPGQRHTYIFVLMVMMVIVVSLLIFCRGCTQRILSPANNIEIGWDKNCVKYYLRYLSRYCHKSTQTRTWYFKIRHPNTAFRLHRQHKCRRL